MPPNDGQFASFLTHWRWSFLKAISLYPFSVIGRLRNRRLETGHNLPKKVLRTVSASRHPDRSSRNAMIDRLRCGGHVPQCTTPSGGKIPPGWSLGLPIDTLNDSCCGKWRCRKNCQPDIGWNIDARGSSAPMSPSRTCARPGSRWSPYVHYLCERQ